MHLCLSPRPSTLKGSLFEGLQHNLSYIDGQKKLYLIVLKELKSNIPEIFGQTLRRTFYSDGAVERALVGRPGSPSVATLATVAPCFAPRFSLHGAAILKTNHYDDDEQQHFPRGTALSPFEDSLAAALQHDERVVGSPRSVCTTA